MRWFPAHSMYGLCSWIIEQNVYQLESDFGSVGNFKVKYYNCEVWLCKDFYVLVYRGTIFLAFFFLLKFSKRECFKQKAHIITIIQTFPYTRTSLTERLALFIFFTFVKHVLSNLHKHLHRYSCYIYIELCSFFVVLHCVCIRELYEMCFLPLSFYASALRYRWGSP